MNEQRAPETDQPPELPKRTVEIRLEDASVLALEPGDVVVLRARSLFTEEELAIAREMLMQRLAGHEVLVLNAGVDLAVLRPPRSDITDDPVDGDRTDG